MEAAVTITDELRQFIADHFTGETLRHASKMADRIDAKSRDKCATAYASGFSDGQGVTEEAAYRRGYDTGAAMAESDEYVKLPLDADGVPIRPGDELVNYETNERLFVYDVELYEDERWLVIDGETMDSIHPDRVRHYHAPTVEDVLREFGDWYVHTKGGCDEDGILAEYAAKLRLAGDGE